MRGDSRREVVLGHVPLEEPLLDRPVDLAVDERQVLGLDGLERAAPELQDAPGGARGLVDEATSLREVRRLLEVLPLHRQRRQLATGGELDRALAGDVVAHLADGPDRVLQRHVAHDDAGLEHPQDQVGRADLEQGRGLAHVAVADDDVQSSVEVGIGVRLVTGVDDRTGPRGGARDALPHVVGPLAQAVHRAARGLEHLAGAGDELPRDEERDEPLRQPGELALALDEVVLMAAVGVAGRVGVVLEQVDVAVDPLLLEAPLGVGDEALEDALAGPVVRHELRERVALGRRVLGVAAHVEVQA